MTRSMSALSMLAIEAMRASVARRTGSGRAAESAAGGWSPIAADTCRDRGSGCGKTTRREGRARTRRRAAPFRRGGRADTDGTSSRDAPAWGRQPPTEEPQDHDTDQRRRQALQRRPHEQLPGDLRALEPARDQQHDEIPDPRPGKEHARPYEHVL